MTYAKVIDTLEPNQEFIPDSVCIYDSPNKSEVGKKVPYKYTEKTRVLSINNLQNVGEWIVISFKTRVDSKFLSNPDSEKLIKNQASFRLADDENNIVWSDESIANLSPNMISKYGEWDRLGRKINYKG